MNMVFFGSSSYVIPIIETLKKKFDLKLVVTTDRNPTDVIPSYCIKNKIQYVSVFNLSSHNTQYLILNTKSVLAVLADFGLVIPNKILNMFPKGILNVHPSLLPKYRGPTPVQTAILNGDKETGVSIIKLDQEVDHGPILKQEKEKILDTDTAESLYKRLFEKSAKLLPDIINKYLNGSIKLHAQNHEKATFTKPLTRADGYIDISKIKNKKSKIERMIRAYFPWPGVFTKLKIKNKKSKIIKLLPFGKIQVEGKRPMSYKDFINGYPQARGLLEKLLGPKF